MTLKDLVQKRFHIEYTKNLRSCIIPYMMVLKQINQDGIFLVSCKILRETLSS